MAESDREYATTHGVRIPLPDVAPTVSWSDVDYSVPVPDELIRDAAMAILLTRGNESPTEEEVDKEVGNRVEEYKIAKRAEVLVRVTADLGKIANWLEQQGEITGGAEALNG